MGSAWNYTNYKLKPGITFEKTDEVPFLEEDYSTLQEILLDKESPYKGIRYDQITKDKLEHGEEEGVDAMSGATRILLGDGQTVVGAALTCFTLWHWINGEIVDVIRNISSSRLSEERLVDFLNEDEQHQILALDGLVKRELYSDNLLKTVVKPDLVVESQIDLLLDYLEAGTEDAYLEAIKKLYLNSAPGTRVKHLQSLVNKDLMLRT